MRKTFLGAAGGELRRLFEAALMRAVHKEMMKMIELKREPEARAEPKTGSKAWLRRRLHAAIVREHLDDASGEWANFYRFGPPVRAFTVLSES